MLCALCALWLACPPAAPPPAPRADPARPAPQQTTTLRERRAALRSSLRLPPDRRFLLAVAAVHHLLTGAPRGIATCEPLARGEGVKVSYRGEVVGELPPFPDLPEALGLLRTYSRVLARRHPLPLSVGGEATPPTGPALPPTSFFAPDQGIEPLRALQRRWAEGPRTPALVQQAAALWARYAFHLGDELDLADEVAAQALALLAVARGLTGGDDPESEVLVGLGLGYPAAAQRLAQRLPEGSALGAFTRGDGEALAALAAADPVAAHLMLLRSERARLPADLAADPGPPTLLRLRARLRQAQRQADLSAQSLLPRELLAMLLAQLQRDADPRPADATGRSAAAQADGGAASAGDGGARGGDSDARVLAALRRERDGEPLLLRLEGALARAVARRPTPSGPAGGLYDDDLGQRAYRALFGQVLVALGRYYLDGVGSVDAAQQFARELGEPAAPLGLALTPAGPWDAAGPALRDAGAPVTEPAASDGGAAPPGLWRWYRALTQARSPQGAALALPRLAGDAGADPLAGASLSGGGALLALLRALPDEVLRQPALRPQVRAILARADSRPTHLAALAALAPREPQALLLTLTSLRALQRLAPGSAPQAEVLLATLREDRAALLARAAPAAPKPDDPDERAAALQALLALQTEGLAVGQEAEALLLGAPLDLGLRQRYAAALQAQRDQQGAERLWEELLGSLPRERSPERVTAMLALARLRSLSGRYAAALAGLAPLLASGAPAVMQQGALLLASLGRREEALALGEAQRRRAPGAAADAAWALLRWRLGDAEEAAVLVARLAPTASEALQTALVEGFGEIFAGRAPKGLPAQAALLRRGVGAGLLLRLAQETARRGDLAQAAAQATQAAQALPEAERAPLRVLGFRYQEKLRGSPAALSWLWREVPQAERAALAAPAYALAADAVLWALTPEGAGGDALWLLRAAAQVRSGALLREAVTNRGAAAAPAITNRGAAAAPATGGGAKARGKGRRASRRAPPPPSEATLRGQRLRAALALRPGSGASAERLLGRHLLGLDGESSALDAPALRAPAFAGRAPYYVGLRAEAAGRRGEALDWYWLAVTSAGAAPEGAWAEAALTRLRQGESGAAVLAEPLSELRPLARGALVDDDPEATRRRPGRGARPARASADPKERPRRPRRSAPRQHER